MKDELGVCEECGRRTAVSYAHANLCEGCRSACAPPENVGGAGRSAESHKEQKAANGEPRETETKPACRDCGAALSDARRGRCLDCEVSRAFDALGEQIEARRHSTTSRTGGPT